MAGVLITILWILFILSALLLCAIVLLQEGKGGGLAEAFGGVGAEAFGVKAGGVTKFTAVLAGVFIGSAILVASCEQPTAFRPASPPEEHVIPGEPVGGGNPAESGAATDSSSESSESVPGSSESGGGSGEGNG